jgi:hypothetical protein
MLLTLALGLSAGKASPQSIVDLTEELVLDAQKLASLKSTLKDMEQGYDQLKDGYTKIRDIAQGNFSLHQAFLDALWILSPAVRNDPRLTEILNTEYRIVAAYKAATGSLGANPVFSPDEMTYINGTFSAVLERSTQAVEELTMVTTDNQLRMSDDQRLQAMDRIDGDMKSELAFLQQFDNELAIEAARRNQESNDINTLKSLYGLPH